MEYEAIIIDFPIKLGKHYVLTVINVRMLPYKKFIHDYFTIPLDGANRFRIYKSGSKIRYIITNGNFSIIE